LSSFTALQTSVVCPVFESITVFMGTQLQVTVLSFSCFTTTQCWMSSAVDGGSWLRMGGGVAATGVFFAAQPARKMQSSRPAFFMLYVFARARPLVDGDLGYRRLRCLVPRPAEEQRITVGVANLEATETIVGILQRYAECCVMTGKFRG
jgi:hypothetical protein